MGRTLVTFDCCDLCPWELPDRYVELERLPLPHFFPGPSPRQTMQLLYTTRSIIVNTWIFPGNIFLAPPIIFTGEGAQNAIFGLIAQWLSNLSRFRFETELDISAIFFNLVYSDDLVMFCQIRFIM